MFDYILLSFLFFLGTLTKLVFFPLYLFKTGAPFNTSLHSMTNRVMYYLYVLINYILTFIVGSFLVANSYTVAFIILWAFLVSLDIAIFVIFYNKNGNSLGSPVAFVILVREILFALVSMILIGVYFSADSETQMSVYGGIIWGLAAAKIIDAFPKFYIFDKETNLVNYDIDSRGYGTTTVHGTTASPALSITGSILNAVGITLLAFIGSITGFLGSTIAVSFLALLYTIYVAGYLVYTKFN